MPRKPKVEKKTITVLGRQTPVSVVLHPPTAARKSWYAYWNGLPSSRSTGQRDLENAMVAAEDMLRRWKAGGSASRATLDDVVLTDDVFEQIQRAHFGRKTDPAASARGGKSLTVCLEAIRAFKAITGLVTRAVYESV